MAKYHSASILGLRDALTLIGERCIPDWAGNELQALPLPPPKAIKEFLAQLQKECTIRKADYRHYANIRQSRRKRIIQAPDTIRSLDHAFSFYRVALARYDFTGGLPKKYKLDYLSYERQNQALSILRSAIASGLSEAAFIDLKSGKVKLIEPSSIEKQLTFDLQNDRISYFSRSGYLSVTAEHLLKTLNADHTPLRRTKIVQSALPNSDSREEYWNEKDVAAFLKISCPTLRRWRVAGGPDKLPYRKFGRSVRYAKADVLAYAGKTKRESTSG